MIDLLLALTIGAGMTLILGATPWFSRRPPADRLAAYVPRTSGRTRSANHGMGLRSTLEPILDTAGSRISSALGVVTDLDTRLHRAGRSTEPFQFRLQQITLMLSAAGVGVATWVGLGPPRLISVFLIGGMPLLAILGMEQTLTRAIQVRQDRLTAELPVVIEQLGMLISAGYSLTSAISQIGARGTGVVAADLRDVTAEIRRGVSPPNAFNSWAASCGMASVERVVAVLALNSEAADLGSLIAAEARAIRAETHRDLIEVIERRSQLVWIPVTVATLVPGLIFLAVPFYSAMSQITGS